MYRIELSPGEETVFRSIEELAVAIKRGVVTARARIYHNASNKWLPIQFHPHYKAAVSMPLTPAALVAGPSVKPLSALNLQQPAEPEPVELELPPRISAPVARTEEPVNAPAPKQRAGSGRSAVKRSRRQGKPQRQLRLALVGALLVGGAQWVLSAELFSRAAETLALFQVQRHLIAAPAATMMQVSSPNTAAMIPVIPSSAQPTAPAQLEGVTVAPPRAKAPSFGGTSAVETAAAPDIERVPPAIDLSVPSLPKADSLEPKVVDSTNAKAIKGILRTVSGVTVKERPPAKR
jgi:hypothetical protein